MITKKHPLFRSMIYNKMGGHCSYCGCELTDFHIDHVIPKRRGKNKKLENPKESGSDHPDNLNPACPSCNNSKCDLTVDEFRVRVQKNLPDRFRSLRQLSENFQFYFEMHEAEHEIPFQNKNQP